MENCILREHGSQLACGIFILYSPLSTLHYQLSTMLNTIRTQTLALIAEITADPKPTYTIDGQSVAWNDYLDRLRQTVDWCDRMLDRDEGPVEIVSAASRY